MDAVAVQKRAASRRRRGGSRLRQLTTVFRCLEAVAGLLLLSWSSAQLGAAARLSGDLLFRLLAFLLSPRFVFLLGNAIVLLLFAKSGRCFSGAEGDNSVIYNQLLECRSRVQPAELSQCKAAEEEAPGAGKDVPEEEEGEEEEEEVDAEEFRQTVETFIAKQLRFRRQESMAEFCSWREPPNLVACF